jgi:hypothetical protein
MPGENVRVSVHGNLKCLIVLICTHSPELLKYTITFLINLLSEILIYLLFPFGTQHIIIIIIIIINMGYAVV